LLAPINARRRNGSHHSVAADEAELDDIYETERRLLYVACTRAREHLLLTGISPVSEYLNDLQTMAG
jgi:ATP-dependent exoDNAse (exonuclease V) beta subunit